MDISRLPSDVQDAARVDPNGEVSWRQDQAADAIHALIAAGHRVLGLDIRDYTDDGTFFEVSWYDADRKPRGWADPLYALSQVDQLERSEGSVERRVLVTWK